VIEVFAAAVTSVNAMGLAVFYSGLPMQFCSGIDTELTELLKPIPAPEVDAFAAHNPRSPAAREN
jgi:hypothetical protein